MGKLSVVPWRSFRFIYWRLSDCYPSSSVFFIYLHLLLNNFPPSPFRWIADSPRWLLRRNKLDRALEQLLHSAALNHQSIPLDLEQKLEAYAKQLQQDTTKATRYWSIWDKTTDRKYIFCIHGVWVGTIILHNVTLLMIRTMGMEYIHVNTVCMGELEIMGQLQN